MVLRQLGSGNTYLVLSMSRHHGNLANGKRADILNNNPSAERIKELWVVCALYVVYIVAIGRNVAM